MDYKQKPSHFSMVTSPFPNFPAEGVENLESTRAKPPRQGSAKPARQGISANNANCIIWVKKNGGD